MSARHTKESPGDADPARWRLSRGERVRLFLGRGLRALPDPADHLVFRIEPVEAGLT